MSASAMAIERLLAVMAKLREPETGCPWDGEQTFSSLIPHLIEETYEVVDAVQRQDFTDLPEELGDLLYQIVFYAQMAQEQQRFSFADVCNRISDKLQRRHPHVFAQQPMVEPGQDKVRWEQTKQQERQQKNQHSLLDDIPLSFPALMRAEKVQKRCASVGFDWKTVAPVVDKVYEELDEVMFEANQVVVDQQKLTEEVGDLLFATVNLSRHLGCKAEITLQEATSKFERRFRKVEQLAQTHGKALADYSLTELDGFWQQIKQQEKQGQ